MMEKHPIAALLGITPEHRNFTLDGRAFEYHPGDAAAMTSETLYTRWADGSRSVTERNASLEHAVAQLLSHRFRRGPSGAERDAILASARGALRGVPATTL